MPGTRYTVDFGFVARSMTKLIAQNVVDPTLRSWVLPDFTTTTLNDTTVAAVVMMATLKSYFEYTTILLCGIPRVTLAGEKEDWVSILNRLEKLKEYGPETTAWNKMLVPVISRFVAAFDDPSGAENIDFWNRVADYRRGGSGPSTLSGWINAFSVFGAKGQWIGPPVSFSLSVDLYQPVSLPS
jgi:hypothetical protein